MDIRHVNCRCSLETQKVTVSLRDVYYPFNATAFADIEPLGPYRGRPLQIANGHPQHVDDAQIHPLQDLMVVQDTQQIRAQIPVAQK